MPGSADHSPHFLLSFSVRMIQIVACRSVRNIAGFIRSTGPRSAGSYASNVQVVVANIADGRMADTLLSSRMRKGSGGTQTGVPGGMDAAACCDGLPLLLL
ncbi:hypothetical protein GCM10020258_56700 [Sphingomonas yabuuchiae]